MNYTVNVWDHLRDSKRKEGKKGKGNKTKRGYKVPQRKWDTAADREARIQAIRDSMVK